MVEFDVEERVDYTQYTNRQLAVVPLVLLVLALLVIAGWYAASGYPVNRGIEFTGGTELRVATDGGESAIREAFEAEPTSIRSVVSTSEGGGNVYIVTFQATATDKSAEELSDIAESAGFDVRAVQTTTPSFAQSTQTLALYGLIAAFVGMSVVVFVLFRSAVPSLAVVLSAFSDIVVPIAGMNLLGIKLSLGTVAALLMLIGYSVDSDILLTNHILRRRGGFYESAYRAMRTGVTMTLTSLSAVIVMGIVARLFGVELLAAIGLVLAFGLATDLVNTYMLNFALLRWYKGVDA